MSSQQPSEGLGLLNLENRPDQWVDQVNSEQWGDYEDPKNHEFNDAEDQRIREERTFPETVSNLFRIYNK